MKNYGQGLVKSVTPRRMKRPQKREKEIIIIKINSFIHSFTMISTNFKTTDQCID